MRIHVLVFIALSLSACGDGGSSTEEEKYIKNVEDNMAAYMKSDDYKQAVEAETKRIEAEHRVIEEAPWFGKTGLDEETERHLPRYLRLEFGESLFDPDSLKAADLTYIGAFPGEAGDVTHYWRVPYGNEDAYARVVDNPTNAGFMDWGQEEPPKK